MKQKVFLAIGASFALVVALLLVLPGLAASVTPVVVEGNPKCIDYQLIGFKPRDGSGDINKNGTYTFTIIGMGSITMTIANGPNVSWISTFGIEKVIVKGGPNANVYSYSPPSTGDTGLTTPTNPNNNKPYGLSHVEFCYKDQQAKLADYGDLPSAYGVTQLGENGARHLPINNDNNDVWLGELRDLELNGVPHDSALGDDDTGDKDEDGVKRGPSWGGGLGVISVTVTGPSCLMGWVDWAEVDDANNFIDFGYDNKFSEGFIIDGDEYTEKVIDNLYLPAAGTYEFTFPLPSDFKNASVFARFRLSPAMFLALAGESSEYVQCDQEPAGLSGSVEGGEVEDYFWRFGPTAVDLKKFGAVPQQSTIGIGLMVVGLAASLTAMWFGRRRRQ